MREKRERDVKSRGWGMPSAGSAALFWRMSVPFSSEGGRVFAGRRGGMKIPGGARRKGKGHDPQARGPGRAGSAFPPGESLASGSEGPEAFSRPRGIAVRRLRRSVCTGLSQSVFMSDTLDAPGLSPAGRRCSRDFAEFGRPAQRRSASIAGRRPENARSAGHQAPEGELRRKRKKKLLSHACGRSRYQAPRRIRCSGRAFFLLRTDRRPSSPPPR